MAKRAASAAVKHRFSRFINTNLEFNKNENTIKLALPGLSYGDMCSTGIPSIWAISKLLETSRIIKTPVPILPVTGHEDSHVEGVIAAQDISISREFYNRAALDMPMNLVMKRGFAGNKSMSFFIILGDARTQEDLVVCERHVVLIDRNTQKSVPFPDELKKQYQPRAEPFFIDKKPCPENACQFSKRVAHSDMDQLYHTNQASYLRFCMDAAADAVEKGQLDKFPYEMFSYQVLRVHMIHQGESFAGEVLDIRTWQDASLEDVLYFQIYGPKGPVFYATMWFHNPYISKL